MPFFILINYIGDTDLVFIHNTLAAFTMPVFKLFFRFRFVLDLTDLCSEYYAYDRKDPLSPLLSPFFLKFEYFLIRQAEAVIAVTETMRNRLIAKGVPGKKIEVVYDGVKYDEFSSRKLSGSGKAVLHLGTVDRQNGAETLLRAVPVVLEKFSEDRFYFIGGGRELRFIKKLAGRLGVAGSCIFTGYLPHEKARSYLERASVGVIPRPATLPNKMVTTLKLYEYWASKTAVVSSRLSGIEEVSEENKNIVFFTDDNPYELAEKIIMLLSNPDYRENLAENGFREGKKYGWDRLISRAADWSLGSLPVRELKS